MHCIHFLCFGRFMSVWRPGFICFVFQTIIWYKLSCRNTCGDDLMPVIKAPWSIIIVSSRSEICHRSLFYSFYVSIRSKQSSPSLQPMLSAVTCLIPVIADGHCEDHALPSTSGDTVSPSNIRVTSFDEAAVDRPPSKQADEITNELLTSTEHAH